MTVHRAEALLCEERQAAAILRAVRREELVLEHALERELRLMRAARALSEPRRKRNRSRTRR
jgi:hypothetical protein